MKTNEQLAREAVKDVLKKENEKYGGKCTNCGSIKLGNFKSTFCTECGESLGPDEELSGYLYKHILAALNAATRERDTEISGLKHENDWFREEVEKLKSDLAKQDALIGELCDKAEAVRKWYNLTSVMGYNECKNAVDEFWAVVAKAGKERGE